MSIEIPGIFLSKPLQACGDPVGTRLLGRTMIGGVEFYVDLYEVDSHTSGDPDQYRKGTTPDNEETLSDVYSALCINEGDWNYLHVAGEAVDQHGNSMRISGYFVLLIYPTQQ